MAHYQNGVDEVRRNDRSVVETVGCSNSSSIFRMKELNPSRKRIDYYEVIPPSGNGPMKSMLRHSICVSVEVEKP